ncbi:high affinity immunoglobulin epsilon receptor subunit alpha-like [Danio aesculapii]|uniref:high affinity immunoglobulin epsilon receptor subunit alpha-like n=1 Tax=Danio aesculapii TaxID=1142201 RepID=UPI0024BF3EE4|nr:high affinity immunoglobulin epsilon receptor subunit alpha-like [Danio aesculapii]
MGFSVPFFVLLLILCFSQFGCTQAKAVVRVSPDQRVFTGETVTLTCDIQIGGNIQWTYSWFKNDVLIPNITERIYNITAASDAGKYSCEGKVSSDAVYVTVSALPTPTVNVTPNSAVFTGDTVNLTCVIQSDHSNWTYEWYKDNFWNKLWSYYRYTVNGDTLTIRGVDWSNHGQYYCKGLIYGRSVSTQSSAFYLSVTHLTTPLAPTSTHRLSTSHFTQTYSDCDTSQSIHWRDSKSEVCD